MEEYIEKIKKYTKKLHMGKGEDSTYKRSDGINPPKAWLVIVIIFFVLCVGVAGYSYWLFQTVVEGDLVSVNIEDENGNKEINVKKVKELIDFYRTQEKEYYRLGGVELLDEDDMEIEEEEGGEVSFRTR